MIGSRDERIEFCVSEGKHWKKSGFMAFLSNFWEAKISKIGRILASWPSKTTNFRPRRWKLEEICWLALLKFSKFLPAALKSMVWLTELFTSAIRGYPRMDMPQKLSGHKRIRISTSRIYLFGYGHKNLYPLPSLIGSRWWRVFIWWFVWCK